MDGINVQLKLRDELQKNENKEACIGDIKKWNVINQDEVKTHCRDWCYKFLFERISNESLVSEFVSNVVSRVDVSELSAASISLSEKGAADSTTESETFLTLNADVLADKLFAEMATGANSTDLTSVKSVLQHTVSAFGHRNRRRTMEDRHVTLPYASKLLNCKQGNEFGYFGVFDGHGGQEAADYAAVHFHANLGAHEQCGINNEQALKAAYAKTDQLFCQHARKRGLHSGTTGVCAVIEWGKRLSVAWLGDSQALLVKKNGEYVQLTEPHKPENEDERKRIESVGGCVMFFGGWRVNGCLTVSRAIGDVDYKPMISSDAGTVGVDLTGKEEYLVLGCDGLFDSVTSEQIRDAVHKHLDAKGEKATAANALVKLAQEEGSSDNITVVVVFLSGDVATATSSSTVSAQSDDKQHGNGNSSSGHHSDGKKEGGNDSNRSNASSGGSDQNSSAGSEGSVTKLNDSFPLLPVGKFTQASNGVVNSTSAQLNFLQQQQPGTSSIPINQQNEDRSATSYRKPPCRRQLPPADSAKSATTANSEVPRKWTRSVVEKPCASSTLSSLVLPSKSSKSHARHP